jgi:hypothetical protein
MWFFVPSCFLHWLLGARSGRRNAKNLIQQTKRKYGQGIQSPQEHSHGTLLEQKKSATMDDADTWRVRIHERLAAGILDFGLADVVAQDGSHTVDAGMALRYRDLVLDIVGANPIDVIETDDCSSRFHIDRYRAPVWAMLMAQRLDRGDTCIDLYAIDSEEATLDLLRQEDDASGWQPDMFGSNPDNRKLLPRRYNALRVVLDDVLEQRKLVVIEKDDAPTLLAYQHRVGPRAETDATGWFGPLARALYALLGY